MRSRKEATQQMTIDVTTETYTHVSTGPTAITGTRGVLSPSR
jgi:hypothetical protein